MPLDFVCDPRKAASNERKHGVSFKEAASAFADPFSLTIPDPDHSEGEVRYLLLGMSDHQRLVVVAHAECGDEIRLISARLANRRERYCYEEGE
ncbi:MAG: BrnT family toxin [Gaiellaceae bacterium]